MRIIILFTAVAAVFSTAFVSCKKELIPAPAAINNPVIYPVQSGVVGQLLKNVNLIPVNENSFELGVTFKSSFKGNIKSLKLHLPEKGDNPVTLWKVSDQSIVASNTIMCNNTDGWSEGEDVNIPIEADTQYVLSVNARTFYYFNSSDEIFPYTKGDITLINYTFNPGDSQTYPSIYTNATPAGFVDFTFQRTE